LFGVAPQSSTHHEKRTVDGHARRAQEGQPDLHPRRGGEIVEQRIRTEPERFAAVLGTRRRARIVIEASTDSEWVARCLEAFGHEVIVADPNFSPM
jgi:transposase